jgi:hypothetical protein
MIMWIRQLISCGIRMKSEILGDGAALRARASLASPRTALTVTTHHLRLIVGRVRGVMAGVVETSPPYLMESVVVFR